MQFNFSSGYERNQMTREQLLYGAEVMMGHFEALKRIANDAEASMDDHSTPELDALRAYLAEVE